MWTLPSNVWWRNTWPRLAPWPCACQCSHRSKGCDKRAIILTHLSVSSGLMVLIRPMMVARWILLHSAHNDKISLTWWKVWTSWIWSTTSSSWKTYSTTSCAPNSTATAKTKAWTLSSLSQSCSTIRQHLRSSTTLHLYLRVPHMTSCANSRLTSECSSQISKCTCLMCYSREGLESCMSGPRRSRCSSTFKDWGRVRHLT